ncbi:MAG: hypothetical protein Q9M75_07320 [Ghiorsea sp.]|nr:hypothetical protein [Ghiorsea sp.]MDQ7059287.1 hypothetical protein [Ghiorsea sp.]
MLNPKNILKSANVISGKKLKDTGKVHKQHKLTKRHLKKYDTAKANKAAKKKAVQKKVRAQQVATT